MRQQRVGDLPSRARHAYPDHLRHDYRRGHERESGETQGFQRESLWFVPGTCRFITYHHVLRCGLCSATFKRRSARGRPDELVDLEAMLDWRIFAVLAAVCLYDGWVSPPAPAASCRATEPIPVRHRRPLANALRNGRAVLHV